MPSRSYAGILFASLSAPALSPEEGFRLGRMRPRVGGAALAEVIGVMAALTIPPTPLDGIETQHLPALSRGWPSAWESWCNSA